MNTSLTDNNCRECDEEGENLHGVYVLSNFFSSLILWFLVCVRSDFIL
jgi:hypothetical protein